MEPETKFRAILAAGFAATLLIGGYHRVRSWQSKEALDRRQEGVFILATLRPLALFLWLGVFAYLINPEWMRWSSLALPSWARWMGVAIYAAGLALFAWTLRTLGTNLTDTVVTRKAHTLVTQGPYRWVRHPFYDAMALLFFAIGLIAANWFIITAGALIFVLAAVRSNTEEEHLLKRFGEPYENYRKSTGRFIPRFRSNIS